MHGITERNTLFVHMLLWDVRYKDSEFYKRLLDAVFISNIHATHVILIMPPLVTPAKFIEENMTRIVPNGETDTYRVQGLYLSLRHVHCPRLKIRRVVEEDNDDIIPILDRESERFKELYGEFYISEMMRYPDGIRQMVVAESSDGLANGVLCLNKIVDVDTLTQHFELGPYHGLGKRPREHSTTAETNTGDETIFDGSLVYNPNSRIIFPMEELSRKDHFKIKPSSNPSTLRSADSRTETDEDRWSKRAEWNEDEIVWCSEDRVAVACKESSKDAPCPGCSRRRTKSLDFESTPTVIPDNTEAEKIDGGGFNAEIDRVAGEESEENEASEIPVETTIVDSGSVDDVGPLAPDESERDVRRSSAPRLSAKIHENEYFHSEETDRVTSPSIPVEISPRRTLLAAGTRSDAECNAFAMELFSMRDGIDERLSYDYLEAVFECFPDQDYCIFLIPPYFPTFPMLQNFVRVPLRFDKDYPMVLYLVHRASVVGDFRTREANASDVPAAAELLANLPNRGTDILGDLEFALQSHTPYSAFVFLCNDTLVGLAVLCRENEIEWIRNRYRIDDFISFEKAPLDSHAPTTIALPVDTKNYHNHIVSTRIPQTRTAPISTFLAEMIPVPPRRQLKIHRSDDRANDRAPEKTPTDNFALYMMVPKVASVSKIDVNVRIVVVGASDCGLAVIESLAFGFLGSFYIPRFISDFNSISPNASSIGFTNLTLVSQNGIPFENRPDDLEQDELPFGGRYSKDYRHLIGSRSWINVVHGTLTAIRRKDKYVSVSSMGRISYDYLVLTCGVQYQRPQFIDELRAGRRGEHKDYPNPENCLTVNSERDMANCLEYCKRVVAANPSSQFEFVFYFEKFIVRVSDEI
ncbi:cilia- and flagella-associated protein 61-like [Athalia rosae]|uniref:cilia- and flagella-associated protein 61-like n=1 Tax=Athalia rosae TaxID=37344 RepID=UPI002033A162|nr:cilia- and flagella-associated protein 61-like [Athalia rosae]